MTLGAHNAGIRVAFAVEIHQAAAATYRRNHPSVDLFEGDITEVQAKDFDRSDIDELVLFGGPPCQGFSTSNQKTRNRENPRNWLFLEFFRLAREWKPEWVVFENVTGITHTAGGYFLKTAEDLLRKYGYLVTTWILNAADYGVPQVRERVFIIGCPQESCLKRPTVRSTKRISLSSAIDDLPELNNGSSEDILPYQRAAKSAYARAMRHGMTSSTGHSVTRNADFIVRRYSHVPPGGNWESIPDWMMANYKDRDRCHTGIYHRLDRCKPSKVIGNFRKNMLIHPTQDRGLSIREAARIQSFPDQYEFQGSIGLRQQQVGNAVPPRLAEAVFQSIVTASRTRT